MIKNNKVKGLFISSIISLIAFGSSGAFARNNVQVINIAVQLNTEDEKVVSGGLKNVVNILEASKNEKKETRFKIVVFGPAMKLFTSTAKIGFNYTFNKLKANKNVNFLACKNTLDSMKLKPSDLVSGFSIIPSGAWEIIKLQKEGYQYFKP